MYMYMRSKFILVSLLLALAAPDDGNLAIRVSPGTIVRSSSTQWLTVRTNVQTSGVADCAMTVNETVMSNVCLCYDCLGNIVARVPFEDVVAIVSPPEATIELALETETEGLLVASEVVSVKK